ncbi:short-chain collagen C4-like [Mya arenaria]|uniref:short-chain collagen C4-like n=1 Tax=Mya arenaria TaxID=6604 RepID=UPI0022E20185|nr:short-chain collagen C4-like [Mya arenaria]
MCNWILEMTFQVILAFSCMILIDSTPADAGQQKRVLLHGNDDLAAALQLLTTEVNHLTTEVTQLTNQNSQLVAKNAAFEEKITQFESKINQQELDIATLTSSPKGGSVYTRWGRSTCPPNGTDLVYSGYTAGNLYSEVGAADYICLTSQPLWGAYDDSQQPMSARIYGTEYQFHEQNFPKLGVEFFGNDLHNHDAPCAVCRTSRDTTVMIPGRNQCYPGWTKEYAGYLVSGASGHPNFKSGTNYACLDSNAQVENGDYQNNNGKLMYMVEAVCGSLRCPPYVQYREITCVVCSK